jgi:hypothetical protein
MSAHKTGDHSMARAGDESKVTLGDAAPPDRRKQADAPIKNGERRADPLGKQERQQPIRDALAAAKFRRVQRRLYRWLYAPSVARFGDEDERREEARIAWRECELLAELVLERLPGGAV